MLVFSRNRCPLTRIHASMGKVPMFVVDALDYYFQRFIQVSPTVIWRKYGEDFGAGEQRLGKQMKYVEAHCR